MSMYELWKQEDGEVYAKHYAKRLSATTKPFVELFNYEPGFKGCRPEDGHTMKVKFQVRRRKIDMDVSILFNRGCKYHAEVAAYVRPLSYGDNGGWETLDCRCKHVDALSDDYLNALRSALSLEAGIQADRAKEAANENVNKNIDVIASLGDTSMNQPIYTKLFAVDVLVDEHKRPLCKSEECGFRCIALRPKRIIEGYAEPVHYCGLGVPGQKPLRNGAKARGIVRANAMCPIHKKVTNA